MAVMRGSKPDGMALVLCEAAAVAVELVQSGGGRLFMELVDGVPQLMGSLKGPDGRYAYVNSGFSQRIGREARDIIGSTVHDLFAPELADSYAGQDDSVLQTGRPLTSHLELIVRADRTLGWYVTGKSIVREQGQALGVAALSIDLNSQLQSAHAGLASAIAAMRADVGRPWRVSDLTTLTGMSPVQLERLCRRTLGLSPRSLIQRLRIEHAVHLILTTEETLGAIAVNCGFYDQSSFNRQFRGVLGITPGAYRYHY
jgi:PAS domain S-box-containing protein